MARTKSSVKSVETKSVVENIKEEKPMTKETKVYTDDEKFSFAWKRIMDELIRAYAYAGNRSNGNRLDCSFLDKEQAIKVLCILTYNGLISHFRPDFGMVKTKNGKLMVGLANLEVFDINPDGYNGKYKYRFEQMARRIRIYQSGFVPTGEIVNGVEVVDKNIEYDAFDEHVRELNISNKKEHIAVEDRATAELNKMASEELA